jgi:beta-lactamase regulating signal transducer with metallopeptidase domain
MAVALAPIIGLFGRFSRRPALVHSLWLVLFVKMLTPPLWPVAVSWPVHSEETPAATALPIDPPSRPAVPVDTISGSSLNDKGTEAAAEESSIPAITMDALRNSAPAARRAMPVAEPLPASQRPNPPATAAHSSISWRSWLLTASLSGSAFWLALACCRLYRFHRLLRLTQRAPVNLQRRAERLAERLGLARCPGIWVVSAPVSPLLWAFLGEPRLLVPSSLLERLSQEQWDTLLAHELAHLRRRDHWVRLLELAVLGFYWWHPVIWWARRRLREAEEQCCDAWVVWALPGAAELYARTLVDALTYLSGARSVLPLAASGFGQMHLLKRRLTMIMRGTTPRALSATGSLAVLGLAAVLLPLYPTLARTEQGAARAEDQQPAGGAGATPTPGVPAAGATAGTTPSLIGGGESHSLQPPTARDKDFSESLEDAKDDVDLLRVQLEVKQAEKREVQALLHQAELQLNMYLNLALKKAISEGVLDKARTEVVALKARLSVKEEQYKEAELRLKQAERRLARLRSHMPAPAPTPAPPPGRLGGSAIPPHQPRHGGGTGFGGGIAGFTGMGGPRGDLTTYEHRLAEVEKKLQTLMEEVKSLRKERRGEKPESDKNSP